MIKTILKKVISAVAIVVLILYGIQLSGSAIRISTYLEQHWLGKDGVVWFHDRKEVEYDSTSEWRWSDDNDDYYAIMWDESNLIAVGVCVPPIAMFMTAGTQIIWEIDWFVKKIKKLKKRETA